MPATYEPIATVSMAGTNTATFSSIPNTYTDLKVVIFVKHISQGILNMRFNGDSTSGNYSHTNLRANGTTVAAVRDSSTGGLYLNFQQNLSDTYFAFATVDIMAYNSSNFKTSIWTVANDNHTTRGEVCIGAGSWKVTDAITSVSFTVANQPYDSGSTATLYGIKAA